MEKIQVLQAKVATEFKMVEVENSVSSLQELVGGHFERLRITDSIDLWFNEEGKLFNLEPNMALYNNGEFFDIVLGNAFFASHDEESSTSLSEEQMMQINKAMGMAILKSGKAIPALEINKVG